MVRRISTSKVKLFNRTKKHHEHRMHKHSFKDMKICLRAPYDLNLKIITYEKTNFNFLYVLSVDEFRTNL